MAALGMAIYTRMLGTTSYTTVYIYIYIYQCVVSYLIAVFASVTRTLSVAISASNLDGLAGHELQRGNVVGGQLGEHSLGGGTLY